MSRYPVFAAIAAFVVDQGTKYWAETVLPYQEAVPVMPLLSLYRTHNTGIAFSMLSGFPDWVLIIFTLGIALLVAYLWSRLEHRRIWAAFGFALVLGGAVGNLVDRLLFGHVVDFIMFHTSTWSFAIFNLADSFITVGAGLIILDEVLEMRQGPQGDTSD